MFCCSLHTLPSFGILATNFSYSCASRTCIFNVVLICAVQQTLHWGTWFLASISKIENRGTFQGVGKSHLFGSGRCVKMSYWDMPHCTYNKSFQSNFFFHLPLAGAECVWSSDVCIKVQTACSGVSFLLGLSVFFVLLPKWGIWKKARSPLS